MIQQTSIEAYREINLSRNQEIVYDIFQDNEPYSNHDVARCLSWEINCVTPRVLELRNMGLLVHSGYKKDFITNKRVMTWKKKS